MPPEVIRDEWFGRRHLLRNIGKFTPLLVSFVFLWIDQAKFSGVDFWLAVASFVLGIAVWAWSDRWLMRNYHCPRCGEHLPEPTVINPSEGEPITYTCLACNVEWDTTLRR